jgi:hypothetical protein
VSPRSAPRFSGLSSIPRSTCVPRAPLEQSSAIWAVLGPGDGALRAFSGAKHVSRCVLKLRCGTSRHLCGKRKFGSVTFRTGTLSQFAVLSARRLQRRVWQAGRSLGSLATRPAVF